MARLLHAKEALMEVDESNISSLNDEDSNFSDEEDMLPDPDIESDIEDDEQDDVVGGQDDWSPWRSSDADLQKYPFTVPNSGAHFYQSPNNELDALQRFLTDELLQEFVTTTNAFASIKLQTEIFLTHRFGTSGKTLLWRSSKHTWGSS